MARNFAKTGARASVRTTSLDSQLAQAQGGVLTNATAVPNATIQAMQDQGMWATNAWGPGTPINPVNPVGSEPRRYEYMIGQNIVQQPRSTEIVTFDTMKNVLGVYDIAQMAIRVRQGELRSFEWGIVPEDEKDTDKYASEIKRVRQFFERPMGLDDSFTFDDLINQVSYDLWAYDALSIYPHKTRGGKLGALEPIDGTNITPLVDLTGRTPKAPAPAYFQWMYGLPWTWLTRDDLIYKPYQRKNDKLYGTAPVEWLLNNINTDIRHQLYFLQYFTDGTIPAAWINAPDQMSPDQIAQLQTWYDQILSNDQAKKHQAILIPNGSKAQMAKDLHFDVPSALFLLTKTCAAWDVTPAELGFTEKVNKSSGETQENVQFRKSIKPTARYFEAIFTDIIHRFMGMPNLYFKFLNLDEQEDLLLMAQRDEIYIKNGVISPDEVRAERLGYDVDAENPTPRMFMTTSLIQTVDDAIKQSNAAVAQTQAQTEQLLTQVEQAKQAAQNPQVDPNAEQPTQGEEQPQVDAQGDGEAEHPEVEASVQEREDAQKAALDFFTKRGKVRFKNDKEEAHVHAFAPKLHKVLQAEGKRFATYAVRKIQRLGKDDSQDQNNADAILNSYTSPTFTDDLKALLTPFIIEVYVDGMTEAYSTLSPGFEVDQQFHAYADAYAQQRTAELVTKMDDSTKAMLRSDLIGMMNSGLSPYDMVQQLESDYAFSESRAFTVARTETGFAWNNAAIKSAQVGGAGLVYVYDGDYDEDCKEADGEIWTVDYAMEHTLEHPNCVRSFSPCLEDVEPDRGGEGYVEPEKKKGKGRKK